MDNNMTFDEVFDEVMARLDYDIAMTLYNPMYGEEIDEEGFKQIASEDTYKHYMAEKKAMEMLKDYKQLKDKLSNLVKDIEALASNNNKDLASIRHEILCNGVLDNGLEDAEESFEAGYGSATEYILGKLRLMME